MRIKIALAFVAAAAMSGAASNALSAFPERPVRIVVVVPPGTGADIMSRTVANKLSELFKSSFIVENRPGGSSVVGSESVARANPNGYSLLLLNSAQTGSAALSPKFPLDLLKDFAPVALLGTSPYIFAASNAFPPKNIPELVAYAKANPGKINYGSGGYGSPAHLGVELLSLMAGIKLTHIPYKGQGAYNAALASDEIQIALGTVPGFVPFTSSGRVRPFAAGGLKAPKEYPNIPTVDQSYPGYDLDIWYSFVTTAGTPREVIKILNDMIRTALTDPAVRADLDKKGYIADPSTPEALGAFIKRDIERWKEVVKRANLSDPAESK